MQTLLIYFFLYRQSFVVKKCIKVHANFFLFDVSEPLPLI
jgi:hypothetical protein